MAVLAQIEISNIEIIYIYFDVETFAQGLLLLLLIYLSKYLFVYLSIYLFIFVAVYVCVFFTKEVLHHISSTKLVHYC